jgi:serine/threonine protein kinase
MEEPMTEHEIFTHARDLAEPDRSDYVDSTCEHDPTLKRRIQRLLDMDSRNDLLLDRQSSSVLQDLECEEAAEENPHELIRQQVLAILTPVPDGSVLGHLDHYEVQGIIGHGGFGVVLKAFDEQLNRLVAIKMLSPHLAITLSARKRFLREARSAAAVRHENVVQIYAVNENPTPYIVMEYVQGQTLQQRFDERGCLPPEEVVQFGIQIASGLNAAHEQGIVHRDIKPANILIEDGDVVRAKLTDFGLARAADDATVTHSGIVLGTPKFMSPEQASGQVIDHRADLFSLGSVLYTISAGHPPFDAPTTIAVLRRLIDEAPRSLNAATSTTPPGLIAVIERLHEKTAEARYQTAKDVLDDLEICLTVVPRRPIQWGRVLTTICVLGLLSAVTWAITSAVSKSDKTNAQVTVKLAERDMTDAQREEVISEVCRELTERNIVFDRSMTEFKIIDGEIREFITQSQLNDLSPLTKLPNLQGVDFLVHPSSTVDLEPMRELRQLRVLRSQGRTHNLAALKGLPLSVLSVWHTDDTDLSAISGLRLRYLNCGESSITDISPLEGMPLRTLILSNSEISDVSPLSKMPLRTLQIARTNVKDISPLAGMSVRALDIEDIPTRDTSALTEIPIEELTITYQPHRDAESLSEIPTLEAINGIPSRTFLLAHRFHPRNLFIGIPLGLTSPGELITKTNTQLESLNSDFNADDCEYETESGVLTKLVCKSPLSNLTPLRELQSLTHLEFTTVKNGEVDLSPLKSLTELTTLQIDGRVQSLKPLANLSLLTLEVSYVGDGDLSSLRAMPIEKLNVAGCLLSDTSVLATLPLRELCIDYNDARDSHLLDAGTQLRLLNQTPIAEFMQGTSKLVTRPATSSGRK